MRNIQNISRMYGVLAIRWVIEMKKYIKIVLLVSAIAFGLYTFLFIANSGEAFRNFITNELFVANEYEYGNVVHQTLLPYWTRIYRVIFIATIIVVSLFVCLLKFLSDRKADQHDDALLQLMESTLTNFRDGREYPRLPKKFSGLDALLLQIRTKEEKQIDTIEKQTQQKNDLISYLAHDMKTPLASVIGYLSLLHDVHDIPKEQNDAYIGIALDKANRLELLIDEFFDITRFNLHDIVISRGKIQMRFLFEQLREQFYPVLIKEHKEITLDMPEDLVYYGDADKLARAFNNILKNAISYSYQDTKIAIQSELSEKELTICFHNHGDEIPKQKLDLIFEKFYRLDKARSTNSGGAGLGLAIAKEIVTAHGGNIHAESSLKETVFIVRLPVVH